MIICSSTCKTSFYNKYNYYEVPVSKPRSIELEHKSQRRLCPKSIQHPKHPTTCHSFVCPRQCLCPCFCPHPIQVHRTLLGQFGCCSYPNDNLKYSSYYLASSPRLCQNYPVNIALLSIFTLGESYLVSSICGRYTPESVLLAAISTAAATFGITFYALTTKSDFTKFSSSFYGNCMLI